MAWQTLSEAGGAQEMPDLRYGSVLGWTVGAGLLGLAADWRSLMELAGMV